MQLRVNLVVLPVLRVSTQPPDLVLVPTVPRTLIQQKELLLVRRVLRALTQRPDRPAVPPVTPRVNIGQDQHV